MVDCCSCDDVTFVESCYIFSAHGMRVQSECKHGSAQEPQRSLLRRFR
jgi:hypothetical protein